MDITEDKMFEITMVSDKLEKVKGDLIIKIISLDNEILKEWKVPFSLPANGVKKFFSMKQKELLKGLKKENVYAELKVITENNLIFNDVLYFVRPKDLGK
jgi:beta-mannosidase